MPLRALPVVVDATKLHVDLLETGTKVIRQCDGLVYFKPHTIPYVLHCLVSLEHALHASELPH
jgi:hypothetical protein